MTGSYTEVQRRAANQIWGAAGHYDFEPMFLAIHSQENRPDFYMNLVIGLAYKYFGEKTLTELFVRWQGDSRQQMLDDLAWLYIEPIVYKLEIPIRPALEDVWMDYAEAFFAGEYKLSRQEWMSKNQLVYTLQSARWSRVSGRKLPVMTPFEKKLLLALTPENKVSQEEIIEKLVSIYKTFYLFDGKKHIRNILMMMPCLMRFITIRRGVFRMRNTVRQKRVKKARVIPGFRCTFGIVVLMLSLIVLIPLASVLVYSLNISPGEFFSLLWKSNVRNAFLTSIGCSLVAAGINTVFGVIVAWTLVKYDFPGKRIVDGLIELPFALPTAVAGITLSKLYSETGFFGKMLAGIGIKVTYTKTGLVIALVFVGLPFVIRAVQPVLEKLDGQYEEAAYMLGASPSKTFRRVILPELRPAILTGFGLALARGIGEYGSVIYISGNSAKEKTQVVSYVIMQKLSYIDYESATAIALVMLVLSFVLLLFVNIVQARQAARTNLL